MGSSGGSGGEGWGIGYWGSEGVGMGGYSVLGSGGWSTFVRWS